MSSGSIYLFGHPAAVFQRRIKQHNTGDGLQTKQVQKQLPPWEIPHLICLVFSGDYDYILTIWTHLNPIPFHSIPSSGLLLRPSRPCMAETAQTLSLSRTSVQEKGADLVKTKAEQPLETDTAKWLAWGEWESYLFIVLTLSHSQFTVTLSSGNSYKL